MDVFCHFSWGLIWMSFYLYHSKVLLVYFFCPAFFFTLCNVKISSLSEESSSDSTLCRRLPVGLGIWGGFFWARTLAVEVVHVFTVLNGTGFPSEADEILGTDNLHKIDKSRKNLCSHRQNNLLSYFFLLSARYITNHKRRLCIRPSVMQRKLLLWH